MKGLEENESEAYLGYAALLENPQALPESEYFSIDVNIEQAIDYYTKVNDDAYHDFAVCRIAKLYDEQEGRKEDAINILKNNIPSETGAIECCLALCTNNEQEKEKYIRQSLERCINKTHNTGRLNHIYSWPDFIGMPYELMRAFLQELEDVHYCDEE